MTPRSATMLRQRLTLALLEFGAELGYATVEQINGKSESFEELLKTITRYRILLEAGRIRR